MFKNYVKEYLQTHSLDELKSTYGISNSLYITNEKNNLVIFSYSQIDSPKLDPIVRMSRGLVLEENTWEIVNYPFYRFFNFEEVIEERQNFNWDKAISIEKIDGSLISYFYYQNKWYISTRSQIGGANTVISNLYTFKDLFLKAISPLSEEEFQSYLDKTKCYTFELVSPFNIIVTPYSKTQLYFIGCRDLTSYNEIPFINVYNEFPESIKNVIQIPKMVSLCDEHGHFKGFEEMKNISESVKTTDEGFVVTDWSTIMDNCNSFPRVKVKNSEYVKLHHLRSSIEGDDVGVSFYKILKIIYNNEQEEFLAVLPYYKEIFDNVQKQYDLFVKYMNSVTNDKQFIQFMEYSKGELKSKYQKEFALFIKDKKYNSIFFNMYNKKIDTWREALNYSLRSDCAFKKIWNDISNWS